MIFSSCKFTQTKIIKKFPVVHTESMNELIIKPADYSRTWYSVKTNLALKHKFEIRSRYQPIKGHKFDVINFNWTNRLLTMNWYTKIKALNLDGTKNIINNNVNITSTDLETRLVMGKFIPNWIHWSRNSLVESRQNKTFNIQLRKKYFI